MVVICGLFSLINYSWYQSLHSVLNGADSIGWRPTNLVHWWGIDGVSQQLAAKWAINTLIHVVLELCIFVVFTCENIVGDHVSNVEHSLQSEDCRVRLDPWWFCYDYATAMDQKSLNNKYENTKTANIPPHTFTLREQRQRYYSRI